MSDSSTLVADNNSQQPKQEDTQSNATTAEIIAPAEASATATSTATAQATSQAPADDASIPIEQKMHGPENPLSWLPFPFFLLRLTFEWMTPLVLKGWWRPLQMADVYEMPKGSKADDLMDYFNKHWARFSGKRRLLTTLFRCFGLTYGFAFLLAFCGAICQVASPLFIQYITQYMFDPRSTYEAYVLAVGMFLTTLLTSFFFNHYWSYAYTVATWLRSTLTCKIYEKAIFLSNKARHQKTSGEIMNLMSVDTQKIAEISAFFLFGLVGGVQVIVCLGLLFWLLKWTPLVGFGAMILFLPVQAVIMKLFISSRGKTVKYTDERIKTINEILQGIRIIKYFTWEESFAGKVAAVRSQEVRQFGYMGVLRSLLSAIITGSPLVTTISTIIVYVAVYNDLTPSTLFTALAYFNILRIPMTIMPLVLIMAGEAIVSITRIQGLLEQEEVTPMQRGNNPDFPVIVNNATFQWDERPEEKSKTDKKPKRSIFKRKPKVDASANPEQKNEVGKLDDISIKIPKGKLCLVVGSVGSGKSSLLNAIIGEMRKISGDVEVTGSVAYCSQQAWIQNATLKNNILFGCKYDEAKYQSVIKSCSLVKDLEILPAGDSTEIGEKGINLSGGQRQRVSLARAVYTDRDVYLLDDVLSAVDAHVGRWIFEKCIKEHLKDKTRVFVTHQLQYLSQADYIVMLDGGRVIEQGTYEELMNIENGNLAKLVNEHLVKEDDEKKDEAKTQQTGHNAAADASHAEDKKEEKKPDAAAASGKFTQEEERAQGTVNLKVLFNYAWSMGIITVIFVFLMFLLAQCSLVMSDLWLSFWTSSKISGFTWREYMGVYGGIGGVGIIAVFFRDMAFTLCGLLAAYRMHRNMFNRVVHAPMSFFDATPIGRIISRFAKDQEQVDSTLITMLNQFIASFFQVLATIGMVAYASYWFLIPFAVLAVLYFVFLNIYRGTARELKRLESVSRSPLFNHFSESLAGISTIRAYNEQRNFIEVCRLRTDLTLRTTYTWYYAQRWINGRLDFFGALLVAAGAILIVGTGKSYPSLAALGLTYVVQMTGVLSMTVRNFAEAESQLSSVERITYYSNNVPNEPIYEHPRAPAQWPKTGSISFENYSMKYRADLPPVLNSLNFDIKSGEKIGVIGRTGAGKSSMMLALYRMSPFVEGKVLIDGVSINETRLYDVRRAISIIPQEPTLFTGTVRSNLDPFNQYDDKTVWDCLEKAHLKSAIEALPKKLMSPVAENGDNFSVGQRQLMCLARALAKQTKILVMDEATASVDFASDALIQKTVREAFTDCTRLTIAHRLNTIVDSDRILVLDKGRVAEFDSPKNLVLKADSIFNSMLAETGPANSAALRKIALGEQEFEILNDQEQTELAKAATQENQELEDARKREEASSLVVQNTAAKVIHSPETIEEILNSVSSPRHEDEKQDNVESNVKIEDVPTISDSKPAEANADEHHDNKL